MKNLRTHTRTTYMYIYVGKDRFSGIGDNDVSDNGCSNDKNESDMGRNYSSLMVTVVIIVTKIMVIENTIMVIGIKTMIMEMAAMVKVKEIVMILKVIDNNSNDINYYLNTAPCS